MSTATLDAGDLRTVRPARTGRRAPAGRAGHLRLVHGGPSAPELGAAGADAPPSVRLRTAPVRITRRGRLALTGTVALVVALVLVSLLGQMGPAGATSSVVVQPGMTLSQIAAEQLPEVPLSKAVVDIQRANKLSTSSIAVGQELVIPGR